MLSLMKRISPTLELLTFFHLSLWITSFCINLFSKNYSTEGVPKECCLLAKYEIKRMKLKGAPVMSLACTVRGQNETSLAVVAHQLCLSLSDHLIGWADIRHSLGMENN